MPDAFKCWLLFCIPQAVAINWFPFEKWWEAPSYGSYCWNIWQSSNWRSLSQVKKCVRTDPVIRQREIAFSILHLWKNIILFLNIDILFYKNGKTCRNFCVTYQNNVLACESYALGLNELLVCAAQELWIFRGNAVFYVVWWMPVARQDHWLTKCSSLLVCAESLLLSYAFSLGVICKYHLCHWAGFMVGFIFSSSNSLGMNWAGWWVA